MSGASELDKGGTSQTGDFIFYLLTGKQHSSLKILPQRVRESADEADQLEPSVQSGENNMRRHGAGG